MLTFRRRSASGPPPADRFLGYDREELDRQYDLVARHADSLAVLDGLCATLSSRASDELAPLRDVAYGPHAAMAMDLYAAARPGAPVVAFLHGGAWRGRDRGHFAFVALGLVPAGCAVAVIDHARAPAVGLAEVVDQARRAVLWLHGNAARFNGDGRRITVLGHSAGGHLAAMTLTTDWERLAGGAVERPVAAVAALSGLFDLETARQSFLNAELGLDAAAAMELSPQRLARAAGQAAPPVLLAVGERETDEYHRNLRSYAATLEATGVPVAALTVPGHHHFSLVAELADPQSAITKRVIGLAPPPAAA